MPLLPLWAGLLLTGAKPILPHQPAREGPTCQAEICQKGESPPQQPREVEDLMQLLLPCSCVPGKKEKDFSDSFIEQYFLLTGFVLGKKKCFDRTLYTFSN